MTASQNAWRLYAYMQPLLHNLINSPIMFHDSFHEIVLIWMNNKGVFIKAGLSLFKTNVCSFSVVFLCQ